MLQRPERKRRGKKGWVEGGVLFRTKICLTGHKDTLPFMIKVFHADKTVQFIFNFVNCHNCYMRRNSVHQQVSKLVFYAQSTSVVISGRVQQQKEKKKITKYNYDKAGFQTAQYTFNLVNCDSFYMKRNAVALSKKKERKTNMNQIPPRQGGISKVKYQYPVDFWGNVHTILA